MGSIIQQLIARGVKPAFASNVMAGQNQAANLYGKNMNSAAQLQTIQQNRQSQLASIAATQQLRDLGQQLAPEAVKLLGPERGRIFAAGLLNPNPQIVAQFSQALNQIMAQKPEARKTLADATGRQRFVDTGKHVFPDVETPTPTLLTGDEIQAAGFNPGAVVERNPDGSLNVVQAGKAGTAENRKIIKDANGRQRYEDTGELVFPGVVHTQSGPKLTDAQRKASGFSSRMDFSGGIVNDLEDAGFSPTREGARALSSVVGQVATSDERQRYNQAQANWIRANLRMESGAVITPAEEEGEIKTYFPQPFDSDELVAQKRKTRELAEAAMRANAGLVEAVAKTREAKENDIIVNPDTGERQQLINGKWITIE